MPDPEAGEGLEPEPLPWFMNLLNGFVLSFSLGVETGRGVAGADGVGADMAGGGGGGGGEDTVAGGGAGAGGTGATSCFGNMNCCLRA